MELEPKKEQELEPKKEQELEPKDVSSEFLSMPSYEFREFLRTVRDEPALSIKIDWIDAATARRLKAFLEDFSALGKQKRSATIRATEPQYNEELNAFASGVEWERVD